ncbi:acyltransferase family protein [Azospirillum doebereinerae]|uniref:Acyltransferase n=1 Tax=Azospirillum doebereinerae TaxID=92933 RepID=A0A3S0VH74_9PROT|nr:acyltransferase [Azospirillum doebereinerae]MCG5238978.1 acyltransferase [Azospirillum doebereinerae]RUQ68844.1 acyltransferase [Azospirillum doebereinerae]
MQISPNTSKYDAIGASLRSRHNNFDFIRFAAATLVLVSHSWPLSGTPNEFFATWSGGVDTGGGLAVCIFFVISGFLITGSFQNARSLGAYALARVLRILPGLVFAVLFTILVIGPLNTTLPLAEYWRHPLTAAYLLNATVFQSSAVLPGVFETLPDPFMVNGSLWTLPVEVFMYALVVGLGLARVLTVRWLIALVAALFLLRLNLTVHWGWRWEKQGGVLLGSIPLYSTLRLAFFFFMGSLLYVARDKVPVRWDLALLCVVAIVACRYTPAGETVFFLLLPYLVHFVAFARIPGLGIFAKHGDVSYGIYIFAFPIQQTVMNHAPGLSLPAFIAVSFVATLAMAVVSWKLVEQPALRLKSILLPRRMTPASEMA